MSEDALRQRFAIAPWTDLDWDVGAEGQVAVDLSADTELQRDILTAVVARRLGNRSLDHTRKIYTKDFDGHQPTDTVIKALWTSHRHAYDSFYHSIPTRTNAPIGVFAFDLAMVRSRVTIDLLLYSARRGMLLESCLLARTLIEQFAYAVAVWSANSEEAVFAFQPQTKIKSLSRVNASAPRAYGLLSRQSHYNPEEHYQFIGDSDGGEVLQRSWRFKIPAIAWFLFIIDLKYHTFKFAYGNNPNFSHEEMNKKCSGVINIFNEIFDEVDFPSIETVRELMNSTTLDKRI